MKRKDFLHLTGICSLGLFTIPHLALGAQDRFTIAQLIGKGNPEITGNSYRQKMHKQTKAAFLDMQAAAAKDNISIEVVSAYRSFERQKEIFEGKYKRFTGPLFVTNTLVCWVTLCGAKSSGFIPLILSSPLSLSSAAAKLSWSGSHNGNTCSDGFCQHR